MLNRLAQAGLLAVARIDQSEYAVPLTRALLMGGIEIMEFTLSHRSGIRSIELAVDAAGEQALIGAGTVLDAETARAVILSGARFVVTPCVNVGVIEMCRRYGVPVFPGALTPTEILSAWQAGAEAVKVFPASAFGAKYLREVKGPLPQVNLVPTGGINAGNLGDFLRAGALAVGVGGNLVDPALLQTGQYDEITRRAIALREAVAAVRREET